MTIRKIPSMDEILEELKRRFPDRNPTLIIQDALEAYIADLPKPTRVIFVDELEKMLEPEIERSPGSEEKFRKLLEAMSVQFNQDNPPILGEPQDDEDPSGQACPECGAVQDCTKDCENNDRFWGAPDIHAHENPRDPMSYVQAGPGEPRCLNMSRVSGCVCGRILGHLGGHASFREDGSIAVLWS